MSEDLRLSVLLIPVWVAVLAMSYRFGLQKTYFEPILALCSGLMRFASRRRKLYCSIGEKKKTKMKKQDPVTPNRNNRGALVLSLCRAVNTQTFQSHLVGRNNANQDVRRRGSFCPSSIMCQ
ncbi:hypothetical protein [Paraburkholderia terrae]|uniref:hypothetical protein n=1 Tax=Paraburkholderia terrae TaxID=311230 RepID=UPI0033654071